MNIHEYQAKEILKIAGIPVPQGCLIQSLDDLHMLSDLRKGVWVVKAQIHAGGRGKGGGVKVTHSLDDAHQAVKDILGMTLVTPQTGPQGKKVHSVYVEEGIDIQHENYLSLLVDRKTGWITFIISQEGGMDIEEVADESPEKITKIAVNPSTGFHKFHGRRLAKALGLEGEAFKKAIPFFEKLYWLFVEKDLRLLEINPLVLTAEGELIPLDAKITIDNSALYRHPYYKELQDPHEQDPKEMEAAAYDLNYIKLDGNIGCLVNGAGLAMATMDIIKLHGGNPANFLDVGGGATQERVEKAFEIILSDNTVEGILVNIFGGIMRCDVIAEGIVAAAKSIGISVPLVVRLQGTNVDIGRQILKNSSLNILTVDHLDEAAKSIVNEVKGYTA